MDQVIHSGSLINNLIMQKVKAVEEPNIPSRMSAMTTDSEVPVVNIGTENRSFSIDNICKKLLELARDKKGIPVNKVTINSTIPYRKGISEFLTSYEFWVGDSRYDWYFVDGEWYTYTKCMDDINKMIRNMLNLHFPDGEVTEEAFNREVKVIKNFSERLSNLF